MPGRTRCGWLTLLVLVALVSGCSPNGSVKLEGAVADGYLVGARVCADINKNSLCEEGEPYTISGHQGLFTLLLPAGLQLADIDVVAEVPITAIDEETGQSFPAPFTLRASGNRAAFVSPITTLVRGLQEMNPGLTEEEAAAVIATQAGVSPDLPLFDDYVVRGLEPADGPRFQRIHRIAQVTARKLAELRANHLGAIQGAGMGSAERELLLQRISERAVVEGLPSIAAAVDLHTRGATFDVASATSAVNLALDTTRLAALAKVAQLRADATPVDAPALLTQGVARLYSASPPSPGATPALQIQTVKSLNGTLSTTLESYQGGGLFGAVTATTLEPHAYWLTESGQWIPGTPAERLVAEGRVARIEWYVGSDRVGATRVALVEAPLAGVGVADLFSVDADAFQWASHVTSGLLFRSGAKGYLRHDRRVMPIADLPLAPPVAGACPFGPAVNFGGDCNVAFVGTLPATTLRQLLNPDLPTAIAAGAWVSVGSGSGFLLGRPGDVGGAVALPTSGATLYGSWSLRTLGGKRAIVIQPPPEWRRMGDPWEDLYVEDRGFVRVGRLAESGSSVVYDGFFYNDIATADVRSHTVP